MINLTDVYICHWKKLEDRKKDLINHLSEIGISNYEWVELYDKDDWNIEEIKKEYPNIFNEITKASGGTRPLKWSEISIALKHCHLIKKLYESNSEYFFILEDDVVFCYEFFDYYEKMLKQLPNDWDFVWVGTCCGLHVKSEENRYVYPMKQSRCAHAYLISKNCASKIINEIKYIDNGIDFYYNDLIDRFNLKSFWVEPALVIQDSQYQTTIQNNNFF